MLVGVVTLGTVSLAVPVANAAKPGPRPANDDFANAQVLTGSLPITINGTNVGATAEDGEPQHGPVGASPASVWYSWTAQSGGPVQVDVCGTGTNYDAAVAVYTGSSLGSLNPIRQALPTCSYRSGVPAFKATAGTTYKIAVDGFDGEQGNFALNLSAGPPTPANDDFADAQVLAGSLPITVNGTTVAATVEAGEPSNGEAGSSVWYSWTAPSDGTIQVDTCGTGTNLNTEVAVYTGSSVNELTFVANNFNNCSPQSLLKFDATTGETYKVMVGGGAVFESGPVQGDFVLRVGPPPSAPPNDDMADAGVLSGSLPITVNGTNVGATVESGEPAHSGYAGASVWYSWTAPSDRTIQLQACFGGFFPEVAVYTGSSVDSLTEVGSGSCYAQFDATSGTTYKVAIASSSDEFGTFKLVVTTPLDDFALGGVARQSNGKLVAAGYSAGNFAVARYNTNGTLDTSFSGDGMQTTNFGGDDFGHALAIQSNGKIVVAGRVDERGANDYGVVRYNSNGSLDTSFSGDGKQTTDFGGGDSAYGIVIQPNGKIVVTGLADADDAHEVEGDFGLARYNANGSLDTAFSGDGRQTTDFGGLDGAFEAAIQSDGKIVAGGTTNATKKGDDDFALARYNADGSLDTSYSGDGKQTTNFGGHESAQKIAMQANGKVVAVGSVARSGPRPIRVDPRTAPHGRTETRSDFALARYNLDGSLDTSFGNKGKQATDLSGFDDAAFGVAIQPDGKIVAAGVAEQIFGPAERADFGLARYNANGTLDTSFSGDGIQTTDFGSQEEVDGSIVIQPDGKIVTAGGSYFGSLVNGEFSDGQDFLLARYNANGTLDNAFNGDGRVITDFP